MKKLSSLILSILVLLSVHANAQKPKKPAPKHTKPVQKTTAPNAAAPKTSLLWKISGNGLSKPSYLFGTIHVICPNDYVWTDKMKESFEKSESLCLELNMADPKVLMAIAGGLSDTSGKMLRDYFNPQQYEIVQRYFKDSLHLDLVQLQMVKPIAIETMLYMKIPTCTTPTSYEQSLLEKAMKEKKIMDGIEDADEQLALLNQIPNEETVIDILSQVEHKSNDRDMYNQLLNAYKKQDLDKVYTLINDTKDLEDNLAPFLEDRNRKWIPRMEDKMKTHSVFFAVGAGHLPGETGVIALLRKAGYTVEAVK